MAVKAIGAMNNKFICLSTDTKPTGVEAGSMVIEYDTQSVYITPDDGTTWTLRSFPSENAVAVTTIDLNQAAGDYDLFTATAQDIFIDFLAIVIPRSLTAEATLTAISIQSTDVAPIEFVSATAGAKANLIAGKHLTYNGPEIVASTKKIQLTIAGGATALACVCNVYASYRPAIAGGYLAV